MRIIYPASPNQALYEGLYHLHGFGAESPSRNGSVVVSKAPVMTIWRDPGARVLVGPTRNANPFFHLVEALWMLAGRNDLPILVKFNSRFASYSDDGGATQPGAYGHRWRREFDYDQLAMLAEEIKSNPDTRRAVLSMWAPDKDLHNAQAGSADVPCNTAAYFDTLGGRLNMSVLCRSNDILWGAYGANIVHFSMLLEYMAAWTGLPMGELRQFSNNFHIYTDVVAKDDFREYAEKVAREDIYTDGGDLVWKVNKDLPKRAVHRVPMIGHGESVEHFDADIALFLSDIERDGSAPFDYGTVFFNSVAGPMLTVWRLWKSGDLQAARLACNHIAADDWRAGCIAFIEKRMEAGQ